MDAKLGAMGGTDNLGVVGGQKLVGHKFQRRADMGAGIDKAKNVEILTDHKHVKALGALTKNKPLGAGIRDFIQRA